MNTNTHHLSDGQLADIAATYCRFSKEQADRIIETHRTNGDFSHESCDRLIKFTDHARRYK